ncbi:MAG: type II toxin-antitoxin system HicB family antitoxin [Candidatus Aminicenantia bacterium]
MAKEYSYTVLIEKDTESGDYIAYAPAFDGCVVQMKTYEEALAEIKEVLLQNQGQPLNFEITEKNGSTSSP